MYLLICIILHYFLFQSFIRDQDQDSPMALALVVLLHLSELHRPVQARALGAGEGVLGVVAGQGGLNSVIIIIIIIIVILMASSPGQKRFPRHTRSCTCPCDPSFRHCCTRGCRCGKPGN